MPPKPKAKPKPQPRRAAGAAETVTSTIGADASTIPKQEPEDHDVRLPTAVPTAPQPSAYKSSSLFIEDHSESEPESESDIARRAQQSQLSKDSGVQPLEVRHNAEDESDEDEAVYSDIDDDPIVQSYDIVLNTTFNDMMYLFQYPVRNRSQPYTFQEGFAPAEARMKVNTGALELDIPINVERNYDERKGVLYGDVLHKSRIQRSLRAGGSADVGDRGDNSSDRRKRRRTAEDEGMEDDSAIPTPEALLDFEEAKRKNRILNRQTLGAKMQGADANYFVALFEGDKLHFTRLTGSLQLRPQFHHIDIMTEQERANQKAMREMNNPQSSKSAEARAVNLSVKTASGDNRTLTAAEQLAKDIRLEEDEPWREIEWVDQDDDEAWQMFANVHKQMSTPLNNVFSKAEYFKWCTTHTNIPELDERKGGKSHIRPGR
ncbi:hypothetical protein TWF102_011167 [Orbilia oligospora]|uniref:Uncharacterized protein n=1 Tax=Orbilia oligospora TaxID=2813651 RepID=A0A7C8JHX9_ORBOL|nr:hypothetical protein TWF102_011167 [Orbilia oligospora]KAF3092753.1 hypothetical protein TWF103_011194 [Orbilia oligospora]KAF3095162.1 hypothetical protein TWF706_008023 [Orbilia oligospora]KAF3125067.1 hypothetical protein TWF703_011098 [Orbilia oligospora]KAF3150087.1 hypothetical protein TWF594_009986 [Orbilia oligospora]